MTGGKDIISLDVFVRQMEELQAKGCLGGDLIGHSIRDVKGYSSDNRRGEDNQI